jgi:hypothetical protein
LLLSGIGCCGGVPTRAAAREKALTVINRTPHSLAFG